MFWTEYFRHFVLKPASYKYPYIIQIVNKIIFCFDFRPTCTNFAVGNSNLNILV